jgi:hypothetical protein
VDHPPCARAHALRGLLFDERHEAAKVEAALAGLVHVDNRMKR